MQIFRDDALLGQEICSFIHFIFSFHLVSGDLREGGVRVCSDAVLRYFWCGFAVIFILTRGIAVSKH